MSLQSFAVVNTLQVLPFYDLDDREFSFVIGNWTRQFDELMLSDLYNLPNPDKNDEADPDSMFINPQSEYCSVSKLNNISNTTTRYFPLRNTTRHLIGLGSVSLNFLYCGGTVWLKLTPTITESTS